MALRSATTRLRRRPRDQRCPLEQLWPANITMIANKLRSFVGPGIGDWCDTAIRPG